MEDQSLISTAILLSMLRGATPLIFAAMAGLFSERSGVVQIGLEGMMLIGALTGAIVALQRESAWAGLWAAGIAGLLIALVFGFFVLFIKIDQIVAGAALNIFVFGLAPAITKIMFNSTGSTPPLPIHSRFTFEPITISIVLALLLTIWYERTKGGLLLQFAGERPQALQAAGYDPIHVRWVCLAVCGLLAGFGGASLSLFLSSGYSPEMTAGRGFIALAALIFGRWKPLPTLLACLFFAYVDAVQVQMQGISQRIPMQLIQIFPYIITMIALAGFFGKSKPPKALGQQLE